LLSISSFIKLPTLEKCEHKNSFIHILLNKFRFVNCLLLYFILASLANPVEKRYTGTEQKSEFF